MEDTKKNEGSSLRWMQHIVVPIMVALIGLFGLIFKSQMDLKIEKSKEAHEKQMREQENAFEQEFFMSERVVTRAGIECVRYEVNSAPAINGFHIKPYVYVIIELSGEKRYIPVDGQFLQEEYVAGQDGICILYRENTSKHLLDSLKELGYEAQLECIVAIEYTVAGKTQVKVYTLRTGQFEVASEEKFLAVLEAWERFGYKIDMKSWPIGSEGQLTKLLSIIG